MMKIIKNRNFPNERDLYGVNGLCLKGCTFDGEADGESALKEASSIELVDCYMNLRYPLWHDEGVKLDKVKMTKNCRAALWYTNNVRAKNCSLLGIKAVRECSDIEIVKSKIVSPEFGWKSKNIRLSDCDIEGEYLFLLSSDIKLDKVKFKGKYSFQYVRDMVIENSELDTKDAFWHTSNVTVKNSVVKGEYLGWYSQGLTLENCLIIGTQPLCYCKGLKLINCKMQATDLAFEYSDVQADIIGNVVSVKNPLSGCITADFIDELIYTDDAKYPCNCKIKIRTAQ